jgi:NTP pyrophosphatase (non-canonical NTP hydrolase)
MTVSDYLNWEIAKKLEHAMFHQKEKFGKEPIATPDDFVRILTEEVGEVCRALNQDNLKQAQHEALQCAAVCLAWLQNDLHFGRQP